MPRTDITAVRWKRRLRPIWSIACWRATSPLSLKEFEPLSADKP
jgi:hypothetical protein